MVYDGQTVENGSNFKRDKEREALPVFRNMAYRLRIGRSGELGAFCHVLYKYRFPIFMFVFVLQKFQIIM